MLRIAVALFLTISFALALFYLGHVLGWPLPARLALLAAFFLGMLHARLRRL
jgi:hypothetical protein